MECVLEVHFEYLKELDEFHNDYDKMLQIK